MCLRCAGGGGSEGTDDLNHVTRRPGLDDAVLRRMVAVRARRPADGDASDDDSAAG